MALIRCWDESNVKYTTKHLVILFISGLLCSTHAPAKLNTLHIKQHVELGKEIGDNRNACIRPFPSPQSSREHTVELLIAITHVYSVHFGQETISSTQMLQHCVLLIQKKQ